MRLARFIRALVCAIVCLLSCGCFSLVPRTTREIRWQGASATTCLEERSELQIWFNPAQLKEDLQIRMPDGKMLRASQLDFESIWPYTIEAKTGAKPPKKWPHWISYSVLFENGFWSSAGGYSFTFENGRLLGFGASGNSSAPEKLRPAVGKVGSFVLYTFPLTEADLIELLGPWRSKTDTRTSLLVSTATNYPPPLSSTSD